MRREEGCEGGKRDVRRGGRESMRKEYTLGLLFLTGTPILAVLEIVDLAGINFSNFEITYSFHSKM